ncbi:MAG: fructosamine kinase family protein [Gordonia sp. (in: high G+C Gram-positive bacteria)]
MNLSDLPDELIDGLRVRAARPVSGGDIARAYRLDTPDGSLFLKWRPEATPDLFEREAVGLRALRAHRGRELHVPEVLRESRSGLVLEWIESGPAAPSTEADLGRGLAQLHRTTGDYFGSLDSSLSGYLGSAEVDLTPTADWPAFFVERRVIPLIDRGIGLGVVPQGARVLIDRLAPRADELCGPPESPALVHGDLWAGNRMIGAGGRNWLIDPAAYWAHREIDLAMMSLFGGFGPDCFAAYDEAFPLADGWRDRLRWYQLPPLLVHAILFGGGYGAAALDVLRRYAR